MHGKDRIIWRDTMDEKTRKDRDAKLRLLLLVRKGHQLQILTSKPKLSIYKDILRKEIV